MKSHHIGTVIVLLIWQVAKLYLLFERRRFRKQRAAFWKRHDANMQAIRSGLPLPFPNNSYDWKESAPIVERSNADAETQTR
jgi:hypothetical protein